MPQQYYNPSAAPMKPLHGLSKNKCLSKSVSRGRLQFTPLKDLQSIHQPLSCADKPKNKTKSSSKCKCTNRYSKESLRDLQESRARLVDRPLSKQNLNIHNRKRAAVSSEKPEKTLSKKERFVRRRKQQDNRQSSSRKDSKRSTDNENQETMIQRLKAENEYYKKAFLTSRDSLERLEKYVQQQKVKRSNEKEWFKYQICNLKKQLGSGRVQLGHIFTFDAFQHPDISNMIIETENQASSLINPNQEQLIQEEIENLSELSIDSK